MNRFPFFRQRNQMDCGPACLYMVARHYGRSFEVEKLREITKIGREGVNILGLSEAAEKIGFRTIAIQPTLNELRNMVQLPAILHWAQNHFVVLFKVRGRNFYVADPGKGILKYSIEEFCAEWFSAEVLSLSGSDSGLKNSGIALTLQTTPEFLSNVYDDDYSEKNKKSLHTIIKYLYPYKRLVFQIFLGLIFGSALQLILPFLTQSIVDTGIQTKNLHFVYIVLFAQLALFIGRLSVDFIKAWILYHISSRINISILTDFFIKLMKLPVRHFDTKHTGDIVQRISDHHRIQNFLTGSSLTTIFSVFSLLMFSVVLASYDLRIFLFFLITSIMYFGWIMIFLKRRKKLDYKQFSIAAQDQSKTMEIIQGMQEIKLHGCETKKRWQWERLQARIFTLGMKGLSLNQWQQTGAFFLNEGKNIVITFLAASAVIKGEITLGAMLAIQYIIGQLNAPVENMVSFFQTWQLAKISIDRLNEIHSLADEEPTESNLNQKLPPALSITMENISFTYPGAGNEPAVKNLSVSIPAGKTTAIVGTSGSGKSTFLKLLLKIYDPEGGRIRVGEADLKHLSHKVWRKNIGVVMQENFIFNDSIASNIAVDNELIDRQMLTQAAEVANILTFIESLPLGFNTKIGAEGIGISTGQKQRILIARAVYKDPKLLFLDEATNSLDANNENTISRNLERFFQNRTVIIVAHRLSTVKNADQIIVMEKGEIIETGSHASLAKLKGSYYQLVKNQLELAE